MVFAVSLLAALQIVTQLLLNLQWYKIIRFSGASLPFRDCIYINSAGAVVDAVTPGVKIGGEITRAVQIRKITGCTIEQSAAIVALQKIFSLSALFVLVALSGSFVIGAVPLAVLGAVTTDTARRVPTFRKALREHLHTIRAHKAASAMHFLLALAIWALYPVKLFVLANAFAPGISLPNAAHAAYAAYMVGMIPIFPGGLGGFEGSMGGLLAVFGFALADAALITLIFRLVSFWLVMLVSLAYISITKAVRLSVK